MSEQTISQLVKEVIIDSVKESISKIDSNTILGEIRSVFREHVRNDVDYDYIVKEMVGDEFTDFNRTVKDMASDQISDKLNDFDIDDMVSTTISECVRDRDVVESLENEVEKAVRDELNDATIKYHLDLEIKSRMDDVWPTVHELLLKSMQDKQAPQVDPPGFLGRLRWLLFGTR